MYGPCTVWQLYYRLPLFRLATVPSGHCSVWLWRATPNPVERVFIGNHPWFNLTSYWLDEPVGQVTSLRLEKLYASRKVMR